MSAVEQLSLDFSAIPSEPGIQQAPAGAVPSNSISAEAGVRNGAPKRSKQQRSADSPKSQHRDLTAAIENRQSVLVEDCEPEAVSEMVVSATSNDGEKNAVEDSSPSMMTARRCFPLMSSFECLNPAEAAIYRALLSMVGDGCDGDHASARVVAGYSDLISPDVPEKTSVKRTIGRLSRKGYIERVGIDAQSQKTCYRVHAPDTVLAMLFEQGYRSWRQVGAGRQPVQAAPVEVVQSNPGSIRPGTNHRSKTRGVR